MTKLSQPQHREIQLQGHVQTSSVSASQVEGQKSRDSFLVSIRIQHQSPISLLAEDVDREEHTVDTFATAHFHLLDDVDLAGGGNIHLEGRLGHGVGRLDLAGPGVNIYLDNPVLVAMESLWMKVFVSKPDSRTFFTLLRLNMFSLLSRDLVDSDRESTISDFRSLTGGTRLGIIGFLY